MNRKSHDFLNRGLCQNQPPAFLLFGLSPVEGNVKLGPYFRDPYIPGQGNQNNGRLVKGNRRENNRVGQIRRGMSRSRFAQDEEIDPAPLGGDFIFGNKDKVIKHFGIARGTKPPQNKSKQDYGHINSRNCSYNKSYPG